MIKYKNYFIEQEGSYYNLYKEVDYEKREGFGRNAATTGEIGIRQENMGYGMSMSRALERINKDQLIDFDGEPEDIDEMVVREHWDGLPLMHNVTYDWDGFDIHVESLDENDSE